LELQRPPELLARAGKLTGQRVVAATIPAGPPGRLGLLADSNSNFSFLVDTGSVFSLVPHHSSAPPTGPSIITADRTPLKCWGTRRLTLQVHNKTFSWNFILAAVAFPIIGGDFLAHFDLKVDLRRLQLEHGTRGWHVPLLAPPAGSTFAAIGAQPASSAHSPPHNPAPPTPIRPSTQERGVSRLVRRPVLPPMTASESSKARDKAAGEFPSIAGAPKANVKSAKARKVPRRDREGEYPSKAGSPGPHLAEAATPSTRSPPANSAPQSPISQPNLSQNPSSQLLYVDLKEEATCGQQEDPAAPTCCGRPNYQRLLNSFPKVLNPSKSLPPVKHHVRHFIETTGNAVAGTYRRLDTEKLEAAKKEFEELEAQGIVRRSNSHWASPLHMAPKKDGTWRPCGDFRRLNLQTKPDRYACPNLADLSARLAGCKVFSKLDLRKGYHQVPVDPADVPKTAVITPFGLFEYLRMPFGLKNAGQTFQRLMDEVLAGLPFIFVYMDDVLVASRSHEEHVHHLQIIFTRLQQHGLVLNGEKCVLGVDRIEYLGHVVSSTGVSPLPDRVQAIRSFPRPTTLKELQTYLGMLNFYRRFLSGAARLLKPLSDALRGNATKLDWSSQMEMAFCDSKSALAAVAELAHPLPQAPLTLAVDASNTHVGAVLQQHEPGGGTPRPLGFFSKKLDQAQLNYSTFDRELLALFLGIRHFRWALEGRHVRVLSDHKPLCFALHRISDSWSARQQRQLSYISEFTSEIEHVPGRSNVVADALSRPPRAVIAAVGSSSPGAITHAELARAQQHCAETIRMADRPDVLSAEINGSNLLCLDTGGTLRPLVPTHLRHRIFETLHSLSHAGITATRRIITARYAWPGCSTDIEKWVRECKGCSIGKPGVVQKPSYESIPIPDQQFEHVHVDLVGPLPCTSAGQRYILTVIDRTTRWPEAAPLSGISAQEVTDCFLATWVARFGVPRTVTTDCGTQFTSSTWKCMCERLGILHNTTTSYHPQANGIVERMHRQLKEALRARGAAHDWVEHLPFVLLGIRASPKQLAKVSAAEATFGTPLALPGPAGPPVPPQSGARPKIPATTPAPTNLSTHPFQPGTLVFVKRGPVGGPLSSSFEGPYKVSRALPRAACLRIGDRMEWTTIDRLKLCGNPDAPTAAPPQRGRPPRRAREDAL